MLNLFRKSTNRVKVADKVWMSKQAKWKACAGMLQVDPSCLFVAWFDETRDELQSFLNLPAVQSTIVLADNIISTESSQRRLVFIEHHPMANVEQELFKKLSLTEVPVLSALDEPFFEKFGGENTIELMKKLGMNEDEVMGHSLVTKSIRRAQEKIGGKVVAEKKARSQGEWMAINIG